jgi:hypothetical protein
VFVVFFSPCCIIVVAVCIRANSVIDHWTFCSACKYVNKELNGIPHEAYSNSKLFSNLRIL